MRNICIIMLYMFRSLVTKDFTFQLIKRLQNLNTEIRLKPVLFAYILFSALARVSNDRAIAN